MEVHKLIPNLSHRLLLINHISQMLLFLFGSDVEFGHLSCEVLSESHEVNGIIVVHTKIAEK